MHEEWLRALEVSHVEKTLQGSDTETDELLGGTEDNSVSLARGH